jgi:hypothetical protein
LMAWGLGARCLLAAIGLGIWQAFSGSVGAVSEAGPPFPLIAARWGLGFAAAAVAVYLTWRTVQIRSTQSATGILYIAMIFILFGELTSLIMTPRGGVIC